MPIPKNRSFILSDDLQIRESMHGTWRGLVCGVLPGRPIWVDTDGICHQ